MKLVGVDVGGTFTDVVYTDTQSRTTCIHKVPTTPADPSQGVVNGILGLCDRFGVAAGEIDHVFHGTTIATNAVLEYKGATTGMVTTEGYRDILHIGRHQRPQHYSIRQDIPWQDRPLVRRRHRMTVAERLTPVKGEIRLPLNEEQVRQAARALKAAGVDSIAVCFLFSYIDPSHEDRAKAIIEEEYPGCFVTTSASVSPQFREFERFTTAAMNAFIGPKVSRYVTGLERLLADKGFKADLHIMSSNGGVATASVVSERPVLTLLSGPAAGVLGGAWTGSLADRKQLITFDVGGTSADIGIVDDGRFAEATARDTWIGGYPVMVPMIDIHTIGAGGGSIAYVDEGGAFKVGPHSAGARPGPAAYGHGGDQPTVTDANVVLGRLDPERFLGGEMALDVAASQTVIGTLAAKLGLGPRETAAGVLTIINANMANAIRSRTVQKGIDPRRFALVAFGGAGPLHGCDVAAELGIPEVLVPPYPGITSAVGLLTTDIKYDAIRTAFQQSDAYDLALINAVFDDMQTEVAAQFKATGIADADVTFVRAADVRYVGQGYELRIGVPEGPIDDATMAEVIAKFHATHKAEYGHSFEAGVLEVVNLRLTGIGAMPKIDRSEPPGAGSLQTALVKTGRCVFRQADTLQEMDTAFYERTRLPIDTPFAGPAIILQKDSTTVVPPGWTVVADHAGNLLLTKKG